MDTTLPPNEGPVPQLPMAAVEVLPALQPARDYASFDAYVALADEVKRLRDELEDASIALPCTDVSRDDVQRARRMLAALPDYAVKLGRLIDDQRFYERRAFYEEDEQITLRVVREQLTMLFTGFDNYDSTNPRASEFRLGLAVNEVYAVNPKASVLESACRHIRRTRKTRKPPMPAELLEVIDEQAREWEDRWLTLDRNAERNAVVETEIGNWREELESGIAMAVARLGAVETKLNSARGSMTANATVTNKATSRVQVDAPDEPIDWKPIDWDKIRADADQRVREEIAKWHRENTLAIVPTPTPTPTPTPKIAAVKKRAEVKRAPSRSRRPASRRRMR
jgi:hypothetical protein